MFNLYYIFYIEILRILILKPTITLKVKTTASFLELTSFTTIDVENIFKDYFQTYLNLNYTYSNLNITSEYISCDVYIPK